MKEKLLKVNELIYEINETTDHLVTVFLLDRRLSIHAYINGYSELKKPVPKDGYLDDLFVGLDGNDSMDDIISFLEELLYE